ncbi:MAG: CARDB domain-containing protein [Euryarchaeota archaeon]|nr:CARDB domain-containing protein [Euryarchaeota archaeon]
MRKEAALLLVAVIVCIVLLFASMMPALASDPVYGPGNSIMAVICVEAKEYKDYVPHYNDHFPPGSTVKIYVEAEGKTKKDMKTGEYKPSIKFTMTGTRPTGATFTASTSSSKLTNHDSMLYKETSGVIKFPIRKNDKIGDYRFRVEATDSNKGGELIGRTPYMHFYVYEDATLYPPINYTYSDLTIEPNPVVVGKTVTVTVNVTNLGGKGNWKGETVYLDVNGTEVKARRTLKLENNENTTATFRLTKKELGEVPAIINISIGGLNGTLVLQEKTSAATPTSGAGTTGGATGGKQKVPGFTAVTAIAAFTFVLVYQYRSRKRRERN